MLDLLATSGDAPGLLESLVRRRIPKGGARIVRLLQASIPPQFPQKGFRPLLAHADGLKPCVSFCQFFCDVLDEAPHLGLVYRLRKYSLCSMAKECDPHITNYCAL